MKLSKKKNKRYSKEKINSYIKEYWLFTTLLRYSLRYLNGRGGEEVSEEQLIIDRDIKREIIKLVIKYKQKLDKKCMNKTGKTCFQYEFDNLKEITSEEYKTFLDGMEEKEVEIQEVLT